MSEIESLLPLVMRGRRLMYKELIGRRRRVVAVDKSADDLLSGPAYKGGVWLNQGLTWSAQDKANLQVLCEAGSDINRSADAMGRAPTTLAHKARELRLSVPKAWSSLITKYAPHPREPHVILSYPYIIKKRDEHADVMAVNDLVPRTLPEELRADVCQRILLDLCEHEVTVHELKTRTGLVASYVKRVRAEQNPWQEVSGDDATKSEHDDERPYYDKKKLEVAANIKTWERPTQVQHVYDSEVNRALALLPRRQREIVSMLREGYEVKDIGIRMDLHPFQVMRRMAEARRFIWNNGLMEVATDHEHF